MIKANRIKKAWFLRCYTRAKHRCYENQVQIWDTGEIVSATTGKGKKTLKEIMNRTKFDKYELEEYMLTEGGFDW